MPHLIARKIAENLLEQTRLTVFGGSFDDFVRGFRLPLQIETFHGTRVLNSEADLRAVHDTLEARLAEAGATDHIRRVVAAEFRSETVIHSTHETRLIRHKTHLQEPMTTFSVLMNTGTGWQVADITYAVTNTDTYGQVLTGTS